MPKLAVAEHSHVGDSPSNGMAERAVQTLVDHVRTLKLAFESKIGRRLPAEHPLMAWLVEHASFLLNKYSPGTDGHTAYGRLHGREVKDRIARCGEKVMWFVPAKQRAKLDQRWRYGFFIGRSINSDQNFVATLSGDVVRARAIIRVVPSVRWDADAISQLHVTPTREQTDFQDLIEQSHQPHLREQDARAEDDAELRRRLKIYDQDVLDHGFTEGCPRCAQLKHRQFA